MTGRVEGIKEITKGLFFVMNIEDARNYGIKEGEKVKIISRRGEVILKVKLSKKVQKGVIFIPFHFYANILTHAEELDPYSRIPEFKICACRIEKINDRQT